MPPRHQSGGRRAAQACPAEQTRGVRLPERFHCSGPVLSSFPPSGAGASLMPTRGSGRRTCLWPRPPVRGTQVRAGSWPTGPGSRGRTRFRGSPGFGGVGEDGPPPRGPVPTRPVCTGALPGGAVGEPTPLERAGGLPPRVSRAPLGFALCPSSLRANHCVALFLSGH